MNEGQTTMAAALGRRARALKEWARPHSRQLSHIAGGVCVLALAISWWADQVAKNIHHPTESPWTVNPVSQVSGSKMPAQGSGKEAGAVSATPADQSNGLLVDIVADVAQLKIAIQEQRDREGQHYRELATDLAKLIQAQQQTQGEADALAARLKAEVAQARQSIREESAKIERGTSEQLVPVKRIQERTNDSMNSAMLELSTKVAELRQVLDQQRGLTDATAREVAKTQETLRQDSDNVGKLGRDLATWRTLQAQAADLSAKSVHEALSEIRGALKQTDRDLQGLKATLPLETVGSEAPQKQLAVGRLPANEKMVSTASGALPNVVSNREVGDSATGKAEAPPRKESQAPAPSHTSSATIEQPSAPDASPSELDHLMSRARRLIEQGNIAMARMMLERAAETGSARAVFELAETYDPSVLSTWGTFGTHGDTTKAQELYAKAFAGGVKEAKDRLNTRR